MPNCAKLTPLIRAEIANLDQRRRALTKMIKTLQDARRALPKPGDLCRIHDVAYVTVRRAARRDRYVYDRP